MPLFPLVHPSRVDAPGPPPVVSLKGEGSRSGASQLAPRSLERQPFALATVSF